MKKGSIYLIPSAIAPESRDKILTPQMEEVLQSTSVYIVEHVREARRFISSLKLGITIEDLKFSELDKHGDSDDFRKLLSPAMEGYNIGILSDAGCPGVADPGAAVVKVAHDLELNVVPLVGPSSILLALMGSGLSGQNFRFNGYLPIDSRELKLKLRELEAHSRKFSETQIFIETPYRSDKMFKMLVKFLANTTKLAVAKGLTGRDENIQSMRIAKWRQKTLTIGKTPTVFLFMS